MRAPPESLLVWHRRLAVLLFCAYAFWDLQRREAVVFHDESMRKTLERHEKECWSCGKRYLVPARLAAKRRWR